jgi:hypothetical protein
MLLKPEAKRQWDLMHLVLLLKPEAKRQWDLMHLVLLLKPEAKRRRRRCILLFAHEEHSDTPGKDRTCLRDGIRTAPNARGRRRILLQ